jgi:hypothetical protein
MEMADESSKFTKGMTMTLRDKAIAMLAAVAQPPTMAEPEWQDEATMLATAQRHIKILHDHIKAIWGRERIRKMRMADRHQLMSFRISALENRIAKLDEGDDANICIRRAFFALNGARKGSKVGRDLSIKLVVKDDGTPCIFDV